MMAAIAGNREAHLMLKFKRKCFKYLDSEAPAVDDRKVRLKDFR
jgi:hypothetical protein